MDEKFQATHPTLFPEISILNYSHCLLEMQTGETAPWKGCLSHRALVNSHVHPLGISCLSLVSAVCWWHWGAASRLHVSVRGAETPGEALEFTAPRSWWRSSQQKIHTSNPASPLLPQKSHLWASGKPVIVYSCSKGWEQRGLLNCRQKHGEKLLEFWSCTFPNFICGFLKQ